MHYTTKVHSNFIATFEQAKFNMLFMYFELFLKFLSVWHLFWD